MLKFLTTLFPTGDFALLALVLGMPLLGAIVNGIWGQRLEGKKAVKTMALSAMGIAFAGAVVTFLVLDLESSEHPGHHVKLSWLAWQWMRTTGAAEMTVPIELKFSVDALSGVMMLVITGVGFLIHLYASSYMENDKAYWRFFALLVALQAIWQPSIVGGVVQLERTARGGNRVEHREPADTGIKHQNALCAVNHLGNRPASTALTNTLI